MLAARVRVLEVRPEGASSFRRPAELGMLRLLCRISKHLPMGSDD
jgi:hypothetical protein